MMTRGVSLYVVTFTCAKKLNKYSINALLGLDRTISSMDRI